MKPLRLAFYGDDFTGSTDAMEALALAGLRTVLFLRPPSRAMLERFPGIEAVGVAGSSRAMTPERMEECLTPALEGLRELGAPIVHYKVCSTFDSSPETGSIGRAIEIGRRVFGARPVPVLAAAPVLARYCVFGNLFARSGLDSPVYRLDRHPTMRHHPVTPMDESDLLLHLSRQTPLRGALFDVLDLEREQGERRVRYAELMASAAEIILFDVLTDAHLARVGGLIDAAAREHAPLFVVGSSGVEYALVAHWGLRADGVAARPTRATQMLVVSGSCSPVSARQIQWALEQGAKEMALDAAALMAGRGSDEAAGRAVALLDAGASVILHTCLGPGDARLSKAVEDGARLGMQLGCVARTIVERRRGVRTVVVGGDTSAHVGEALGIESLEMIAPIEPGSPLCRASGTGAADGLEIVFKGGQVGKIDYLGKAQGDA